MPPSGVVPEEMSTSLKLSPQGYLGDDNYIQIPWNDCHPPEGNSRVLVLTQCFESGSHGETISCELRVLFCMPLYHSNYVKITHRVPKMKE